MLFTEYNSDSSDVIIAICWLFYKVMYGTAVANSTFTVSITFYVTKSQLKSP